MIQGQLIRVKFITIVLLILSQSTLIAQSDICEDKANGAYWPVNTGVKRYYVTPNGTSVEYYNGDSLQADGKISL